MNNKNFKFGIYIIIFLCLGELKLSYGQSETFSQEFYLQKYEEYLKSLTGISFSYHNFLLPEHHGEIKYNGDYLFLINRNEKKSDASDYAREYVCSKTEMQWLQYDKSKTHLELFGYLDPSKNKNYKLTQGFVIPELFGYTSAYPVLENAFIPAFLRSIRITATKDNKNGTELILLSGQKGDMTIKVWLDPAQNFLMRFLEIHQSNTSKTDEMIEKTIVLDKFIDVKGVKVPTFYENSSSQVNVNNKGSLNDKYSIKLDHITIENHSKPKPFSFKTKIPDGTKVVLFDAQQIQYVWMDGKIVVKTDEVALAIARGGHKFIPGPDQPRFWMMALGIIMMLVGGGLKLRDMLKES
jgi:hypothetical protein